MDKIFRIFNKKTSSIKEINLYWFEENYIRNCNDLPEYLVLQQFTGKLDESGKKIFEGDFVTYSWKPFSGGNYVIRESEVVYDEKLCAFTIGGLPIGDRSILKIEIK